MPDPCPVTLKGDPQVVTGLTWLDHECLSEYLPPGASGWDWIGVNRDDGSGLMAFQMRGQDGPRPSLRDA